MYEYLKRVNNSQKQAYFILEQFNIQLARGSESHFLSRRYKTHIVPKGKKVQGSGDGD